MNFDKEVDARGLNCPLPILRAKKMLAEAGVRRVAIIANVLPFSQENLQFLTPALEAAGIEIAMSENYPPDISDMTPLLTQVRDAAPDAVLALTYPADAFLYAGQARELRLEVEKFRAQR